MLQLSDNFSESLVYWITAAHPSLCLVLKGLYIPVCGPVFCLLLHIFVCMIWGFIFVIIRNWLIKWVFCRCPWWFLEHFSSLYVIYFEFKFSVFLFNLFVYRLYSFVVVIKSIFKSVIENYRINWFIRVSCCSYSILTYFIISWFLRILNGCFLVILTIKYVVYGATSKGTCCHS